jgi:hypothetical protein
VLNSIPTTKKKKKDDRKALPLRYAKIKEYIKYKLVNSLLAV